MSYFPKPSLNENDLAIIERGDTAAHSIEVGQYVSWHGKIGKAKAAILQGATLSESLFDYDEDGVLNAPLTPQYDLLLSSSDREGTNRTLAHSLSDYRFIIFGSTYDDDTELLSPICIPVSLFIAKTRIRVGYYSGGGTAAGPSILYYVNDTTVQLYTPATKGHCVLYGLK